MSKNLLGKSQVIMSLSTKTRRFPSETIPFDCEAPDEDDEFYLRHQFFLHHQVWKDMGSPETITVTIEPGDKLNG